MVARRLVPRPPERVALVTVTMMAASWLGGCVGEPADPEVDDAQLAPLPMAGPYSDEMGWVRQGDSVYGVTPEGIEERTLPGGAARLLVPGAFGPLPISGLAIDGSESWLVTTVLDPESDTRVLRAFARDGTSVPVPDLGLREFEFLSGLAVEGDEIFVATRAASGGHRVLAIDLRAGGVRTVASDLRYPFGFSLDVRDGVLWGIGCSPPARVSIAGGVPEYVGGPESSYCPTLIRVPAAGVFLLDYSGAAESQYIGRVDASGQVTPLTYDLVGSSPVFAVDGTSIYQQLGAELVAIPLGAGRGTRVARLVGSLRSIAVDPEGVFYMDDAGFHALLRARPPPAREPPPIVAVDPPPPTGLHDDATQRLAMVEGRAWWLGGPANPGLWSAGVDGEPRLEHPSAPSFARVRSAGPFVVLSEREPARLSRFSRRDGSLVEIPPPAEPALAWTTNGESMYELSQDLHRWPVLTEVHLDTLEREVVATFETSLSVATEVWVEVGDRAMLFPEMSGESSVVWRGDLGTMMAGGLTPISFGRARIAGPTLLLCGSTGGSTGLFWLSPDGASRRIAEGEVDCDVATDGIHVYRFQGSRLVADSFDPLEPQLFLAEVPHPVGVAVDASAIYVLEDDLGFRAVRVLPRPTR